MITFCERLFDTPDLHMESRFDESSCIYPHNICYFKSTSRCHQKGTVSEGFFYPTILFDPYLNYLQGLDPLLTRRSARL